MSLARKDIVAETRDWIGTPYRHQASLKGVGCDCLGLVRGVWRNVIGLPTLSKTVDITQLEFGAPDGALFSPPSSFRRVN